MGASTRGGGTARAQAHLRDGLACIGGPVMPLPEVLVPLAGSRFDDEGSLLDDGTRLAVHDLLVSLADCVRELREGVRGVA